MATAADAGRVVCPQCGANNFNTQAACWKCGAGLVGGRVTAASAFAPQRPGVAAGPPAPVAMPAPALGLEKPFVDPSIAIWWAIIFAVVFPSIAIPLSMVLFMLDDQRKNEIGRVMLIAGVIAFVLHMAVTWVMMQGIVHELISLSKTWGAVNGHAQPNLNDTIDTSKFPAGFR